MLDEAEGFMTGAKQKNRHSCSSTRVLMAPLLILLLAAGLCISARADDDPSGRVARLNFLQGVVSFQPAGGGDNDWVDAVPNRPIVTGDRVWCDSDGRAELHVGSTAIRLDHQTGISFLNLTDNIVQLQVSAGVTIVRLRRLDPNDTFEIDSPNLAFSVLRPGNYRVDVDPDKNATVVSVLQGEGEVTGGGRSYKLISDQRATFTGTDTLTYDLADADAVPPTEFDTWAADRNHREDHLASARYVSPEMTGSEDLDTYGTWRTVPDYGPMWVPTTVAVGWAPYRYGHWAWIAPYGWTWVEDEPWGFAPFHYGRWAFVAGTWGWVPGPVVVRPVYAPALVAWVGGGPGFNFSVAIGGGGGVGWFALGPREVYVPAYRVSEAYVTRVNVTNTVVERNTVINMYHNTNVTNVTYVNQHVGGGVTVVSHDTFVNARPVAANVARVPERELAAAPVSRGMQVQPEHASFVGAGRPASRRPPAAVLNRPAVVRAAPAPPAARFDRGPNTPANTPVNTPAGPPVAPGYRPFDRNDQGRTDQGRGNSNPGGNAGVGANNVNPNGVRPNNGNPSGVNPNNANPNNARPNNVSPVNAAPNGASPNNPGANPNARDTRDTRPPVRTAPPVRAATPAEQQTDVQKQHGWQQQHEQVHQNDSRPAKPQPKSDAKDSKKDRGNR